MEDQVFHIHKSKAPNLGLKALRAPHQYSRTPEFPCTNCRCARFAPCKCERTKDAVSKTQLRRSALKQGVNGKGPSGIHGQR